MNLKETIPTRSQLYEFAKVSQGATIATLHEAKPFQFLVEGDHLHFVPSSGKPRKVDSRDVDKLLQKLTDTRSLKPTHYQDDSHNASYLLPLVLAWQVGSINSYAGARARSPLGTLTEAQRDILFERVVKAVSYRVSVKPVDGRLQHGFELMSKATKEWVGTVYWSNNLIGNDVEIVFNLIQLANGEQEHQYMKLWFDSASLALRGRPAWNHSGKEESWYRRGFSLDAALQFFNLLRPQLDAMTRNADRWQTVPSRVPADPQAVMPGSLPTVVNLAPGAEESKTAAPDGGPAESLDLYGSPELEETISLMVAHAQKASEESGVERTTVRKTKHQKFVDGKEGNRIFKRHRTPQEWA